MGVLVTASLLESPGLYLVFWLISTMLSFGWSLLILLFPSAPFTISITVTFMVHSFLFSCKVFVLISLFAFLQFYPVVSQNGKVYYLAGSLFLLTITKSAHQAEIRWSICISKSQRILCILFSRMDSVLFIYHLVVWSNLNFLHNSQWIIFPPSHVLSYTLFALINCIIIIIICKFFNQF